MNKNEDNYEEITFIYGYVQALLFFLGTNQCRPYIMDITKEERGVTLNTLYKIKNNIINEVEKNEKV